MIEAGIYRITNTKTGRQYIGSSGNLTHRLREHKRHLILECHPNTHLQASFDKHGLASFDFDVVEVCVADDLLRREQMHLDSAIAPLYNMVREAGSPRGYRHTEDARARIGARWSGQKRGPHSEEHRANLSASLKGRTAWNKKEHPLVVCQTCGAVFTVKPYKLQTGRGKFCSKPCTYKSFEKAHS